MALITRSGAVAGLLAAASMLATPANAAEMPQGIVALPTDGSAVNMRFDQSSYDGDTDITEYRRWGRRGWRRGWRRHRGIRAGDVLAGAVIIGGIAAIASAASNNRRRQRDVVIVERDHNIRDREVEELRRRLDEQERELDYLRSRGVAAEPYRGSSATPRADAFAPLGIEGAIDQCVATVERNGPISGVDGVDRVGSGWSVRGRLADGESFDCRIGGNGQIEGLNYDRGFSSGQRAPEPFEQGLRAEGQLSDDVYSGARLAMAERGDPREPLAPLGSDRLPAYPGGPLPGELIDGDLAN